MLLSTYTLTAQTVLFDPAKVYIGTTHGINSSMVMFNPSVEQTTSPLSGYTGGITFRYITEKHVGLQAEINYVQRGWSEKSGYKRQTNYIELPFLTHIYLGNTHRVIFNLGPKFGYLLNESVLANDSTSNAPAEEQIQKIHFPFDYGITTGLGYNLHTKKAGVFELEFRAYYGLSDIFANTKSDYFSTSNYLNFTVKAGWYFQLTRKSK